MRRNRAETGFEEGHQLRPRPVRRGWGRVDGGGHDRADELVRENADRSARRRADDRRIRVVRDLIARRVD